MLRRAKPVFIVKCWRCAFGSWVAQHKHVHLNESSRLTFRLNILFVLEQMNQLVWCDKFQFRHCFQGALRQTDRWILFKGFTMEEKESHRSCMCDFFFPLSHSNVCTTTTTLLHSTATQTRGFWPLTQQVLHLVCRSCCPPHYTQGGIYRWGTSSQK